MRMLIFAMLIALAGSSFALTDAYKECIQTCCVNSGGTYLWDSNGCESPGASFNDACTNPCHQFDEPQTHGCIFGAILLSLAGAAFITTRK